MTRARCRLGLRGLREFWASLEKDPISPDGPWKHPTSMWKVREERREDEESLNAVWPNAKGKCTKTLLTGAQKIHFLTQRFTSSAIFQGAILRFCYLPFVPIQIGSPCTPTFESRVSPLTSFEAELREREGARACEKQLQIDTRTKWEKGLLHRNKGREGEIKKALLPHK